MRHHAIRGRISGLDLDVERVLSVRNAAGGGLPLLSAVFSVSDSPGSQKGLKNFLFFTLCFVFLGFFSFLGHLFRYHFGPPALSGLCGGTVRGIKGLLCFPCHSCVTGGNSVLIVDTGLAPAFDDPLNPISYGVRRMTASRGFFGGSCLTCPCGRRP